MKSKNAVEMIKEKEKERQQQQQREESAPANNPILEGFEIVASDSVPSITLDNQRRFYLSKSARRLMDVEPYEKISLAYNPKMKALALVRPSAGISSKEAAEYATSIYSIDRRFYMSARHFADKYGYTPSKAPYSFVYERGASDGSVFIFRLV